uniref:Uncharacterized protein n=1 Tax=Gopherus agassizii TaxID=38772 RepID=A0A452IBF2_9SAUR
MAITYSPQCLLHVCLTLLSSPLKSHLGSHLLHFQQNKVNKESLELLKKMSGIFPSQCIRERTAFKPTQEVSQLPLFQKDNAKMAMQEILQEIFNIFSKNLTQTQMEKDLTNPQSEDLQHSSQKVKQYFQGIDAFLKEKQYSLCAWEIIGMEIPRCFVLIDKLTRSLSN